MDRLPEELMHMCMASGGGEDDNGAKVTQVPENDNPTDPLLADLTKVMETSTEEETEKSKDEKDEEERRGRPLKRKERPGKGEPQRKKKKKGAGGETKEIIGGFGPSVTLLPLDPDLPKCGRCGDHLQPHLVRQTGKQGNVVICKKCNSKGVTLNRSKHWKEVCVFSIEGREQFDASDLSL